MSQITLITPSFNQGQFLEQTIMSVLSQKEVSVEYMVIDGASSDNSLEIIKKYESQLSFSESIADKGQSDAINKGIKRAKGAIFNWLCSDDYLEEDALKIIQQT